MDDKDHRVKIEIHIDVQALAVIVGFFFTVWLGLGWI